MSASVFASVCLNAVFHLATQAYQLDQPIRDEIVLAQYDRDPSSAEVFQHVPMYKGDTAPYDGILMKGRRYATLKLAELRVVIIQQQLNDLQRSYNQLEQWSGTCRVRLSQGCPPPPACPEGPAWYESGHFWLGVLGGCVASALVAFLASL